MAKKTQKRMFSIRYKYLVALLGTLLTSLSIFFYFAYVTFSEDKAIVTTDNNLAVLKAISAELKSDVQSKILDIQSIIPTIYDNYKKQLEGKNVVSEEDPFDSLSAGFQQQLLGLSLFRVQIKDGQNDVTLSEPLVMLPNAKLLSERNYPADLVKRNLSQQPIKIPKVELTRPYVWLNRSMRFSEGPDKAEVAILTLVLRASQESTGATIYVALDIQQDFIRKKLKENGLFEMFLVKTDGHLISHWDPTATVEFASRPFDHPIMAKIQSPDLLPVESTEMDLYGEQYWVSLSQTGFAGLYLVSQVSRAVAFKNLDILIKNFIFLALVIVCVAIIVTVFLAGRLTGNVEKMRDAAERIGRGELDIKLNIKTNDELQSVSNSLEWMAQQISTLLEDSVEKARMKGELETAQLVQSTLLSSPKIESDKVKLSTYYSPASECGGDFMDAYLSGNKLTVLIGDATGHGASAALLTAVAKSYSSTLHMLFQSELSQSAMPLEKIASVLNAVVYKSCRGQLLMTMSLIELDLLTGEVRVCNAGHESPMRFVSAEAENKRANCDVLFARGERLGFDPKSVYESVSYQLQPGDSILLYTDGVTEVTNAEGKEWGERSLKKVFAASGRKAISELKMDIAESVTTHRGSTEQGDDITFVIIKWEGSALEKKLAS